MSELIDRRRWLGGGLAGAGLLTLGGCERLARSTEVRERLEGAERLTYSSQRLLLNRGDSLAREYGERDIQRPFPMNGSRDVADPAYRRHLDEGFTGWRLRVDGLVARPLSLSLDQLRAAPARTQITRHDCVEGWSAIGKWTGVPLARVLNAAGLRPEARFIVFHCADTLEGARYYESIDLVDAFHPQTILAYRLNDAPLPVGNGAPLRLRVERQLGYKHAKFVMRIEAVNSYAGIAGGRGGFWEDRGYEWYAGI